MRRGALQSTRSEHYNPDWGGSTRQRRPRLREAVLEIVRAPQSRDSADRCEAVISVLVAGVLPGSAAEERMLRLAASLGEAITGTDAMPACRAVRNARAAPVLSAT